MTLSKLATELKKRNPFEMVEEEAYLNLLRTTQWLQHDAERLFKTKALSEALYNVLRILRGAGGEGLPSLEIAGRMVTRVPDVTRLVDRLVARGLVDRTRPARDRRLVLVSITQAGLELLSDLDQPAIEMARRQFAHMTRDELESLNRLLEKAREATPGPCETD